MQFFVTGWIHVLLAPYTKVEESFNLHATHDLLFNRPLSTYDHNIFPGAVPRTFIGAVLLAWISKPIILLATWTGLVTQKSHLQIIIRLVLSSLNALTLSLIRRAVSRRFGRPTAVFYTLLSITQFHLPFWMGRTLPNMLALIPVNLSTYLLLLNHHHYTSLAISLLTFTTITLRSELLLYLIPLSLHHLLLTRSISLPRLIKVGLGTALISIPATVLIDSYFWGKNPFTDPLWPEAHSLYFNVFLGQSSAWGTSPWHTYLTHHLPKLLLSSLPLSLIGFISSSSHLRAFLLPSLVFLALISVLPHKEWRFIIYVVPIFNVLAARGAAVLFNLTTTTTRGKSATGYLRPTAVLAALVLVGSLVLNVAMVGVMERASVRNYPGGEALARVHAVCPPSGVHVHIGNLAAQTGASLFLQENAEPYWAGGAGAAGRGEWVYDKTEGLTVGELTARREVTHLVSEVPPREVPASEWRLVEPVTAFTGFSVSREVIRQGEVLWIYERVVQ